MPAKITASKPTNETEDQRALADILATATNAQIDAHIDNAVTDLASARAFLKRLTRVVRTLARRTAA